MLVGWFSVQNLSGAGQAESGVGRCGGGSNLGTGHSQRGIQIMEPTQPTKCNFNPRNKFRQKGEKYCIQITMWKQILREETKKYKNKYHSKNPISSAKNLGTNWES